MPAKLPSKLKVFRTAIGFHDAYVAAPSQKAALAAWGTDKPLFARGAAEIVTDPALTAAPLAAPGTVIKRLRGSAAEQIAALPPDRPRKTKPSKPAKPRREKPKPKPDRGPLEAAEDALAQATRRFDAAMAELAARERALRDARHALEQERAEETARLEQARDAARAHYAAALRDWQG